MLRQGKVLLSDSSTDVPNQGENLYRGMREGSSGPFYTISVSSKLTPMSSYSL